MILKYPITEIKNDQGEMITIPEIKELTFVKRVKTKHLKKMPKAFFNRKEEGSDFDPVDIVPVISLLVNQPENVVDEIDIDDLEEVMSKMDDLLGKQDSPTTGGK